MTVIAVDDTDSRTAGMCTTFIGARLADRLETAADATVTRRLLVRLNPAAPHKTRGNAAVAVHTDADPTEALRIGRALVAEYAETDDPDTNPGIVVAPGDAASVPDEVLAFSQSALTDLLTLDRADRLIDRSGYRSAGWGVGRGRIGALAAVGAWASHDDWTYEHIAYREATRWGTPREIDHESVFDAADAGYPATWDTVDRVEGETVCVPHTPGPVLYGIRGDDPAAVGRLSADIEGESPAEVALFVTNQGTDAHLQPGRIDALGDGGAYRVTGTVASPPETREGGHVFVTLREDDVSLPCAAFEPTKRFRDRVRGLRVGDRVTVCGEVAGGTLKLEKFAVHDLVRTVRETPTCPDCDRSMESAGAGQGYRCRDCNTTAPGKVERPIDRTLERGWYEVPPCARRHVATPRVGGGSAAPTHPDR